MGGQIRFSLGEFPLLLSTTTMKAVPALLLICLIKLSLGEEREDSANDTSSVGNLLLPRITRETGRKCKKGDRGQKCQNKLWQEKKRNTNRTKRWKVKTTKTKISKKGAKIEKNKSTRKLNNRKKKRRKQPKKISKKKSKKPKKISKKKSKKNRRKVKNSKTKKSKTSAKKGSNVEKKKSTKKFNR